MNAYRSYCDKIDRQIPQLDVAFLQHLQKKKTRQKQTASVALLFLCVIGVALMVLLRPQSALITPQPPIEPPGENTVSYAPLLDNENQKDGMPYFYLDGRIYTPVTQSNACKCNQEILLSKTIPESAFGEHLGRVSRADEEILLGADLYRYTPHDSDAYLIARKGDRCQLFKFILLEEDGHAITEIFDLFPSKIQSLTVTGLYHNEPPKDPINVQIEEEAILQNLKDLLQQGVPDDLHDHPDPNQKLCLYHLAICFESDATIDLALLPDGSQVYGFNKYWSFNSEQARQLKALMEEITEA